MADQKNEAITSRDWANGNGPIDMSSPKIVDFKAVSTVAAREPKASTPEAAKPQPHYGTYTIGS